MILESNTHTSGHPLLHTAPKSLVFSCILPPLWGVPAVPAESSWAIYLCMAAFAPTTCPIEISLLVSLKAKFYIGCSSHRQSFKGYSVGPYAGVPVWAVGFWHRVSFTKARPCRRCRLNSGYQNLAQEWLALTSTNHKVLWSHLWSRVINSLVAWP